MAIHGWTRPEQLIWLMKAIHALPDSGIAVEIGVWQGRSALSMAEACRGTRKKVYAIDPWLDGTQSQQSVREVSTSNVLSFQEAHTAFLANLQYFELQDWCIPIRDTSLNVAKTWQHGLIDLIFVDGSHEYDAVAADLEAWMPLIKTGGIICGDDWSWQTVRSAVLGFVNRHQSFQLEIPCANTWCARS
jgi:predicted O-methyltransferase YrrM